MILEYVVITLNTSCKKDNNSYDPTQNMFFATPAATFESGIMPSPQPPTAAATTAPDSIMSSLQMNNLNFSLLHNITAALNLNLNMKTKNQTLQITDDDLRIFVQFAQQYNRNNHTGNGKHPHYMTNLADGITHGIGGGYNAESVGGSSGMDECVDYCTGDFYQFLRAYNGVHGYVALMICIFGTIANILNIMVLTKKDMAKAPINKILKWLAVADMFVMIEYIPFASYQYIYMKPGEKDFSYAWAVYVLFHMHFTQVLHTISIGLTVTLAIWRYVAIRHPHGPCASFLLSHCYESILFSFVISPIVCFPTLFVFKVRERMVADSAVPLYHVDADKETQLYRINFWIHSVIIKLLPCCILTVISFVLVKVLCEASKRKQKLKEYSNPNKSATEHLQKNTPRTPKCDRRTDRTTMLLVAVLILFLITEFPQGILGLMSGIMEKCFFNACYPPFGELMDLLALINAAIDFVLYGLMSKQFRTTFKSLFFKKRFGSIEMTRATRLTTTCV